MKNLKMILMGWAALFLAAAPAYAITLTFEGLQDFEPVTSQYSANGVSFTNATAAVAPPEGSLNEIDFPPVSGVTVLTNEIINGSSSELGTMFITFGLDFDLVSGYFVYSDFALTGDPLSVAAFGADPVNPLQTLTLLENLGSPSLLSFSGLGPIASLRVAGGEGSYFTLDNLSVGSAAAVVPEPATLFLFSLGAFGLVSKRFKK